MCTMYIRDSSHRHRPTRGHTEVESFITYFTRNLNQKASHSMLRYKRDSHCVPVCTWEKVPKQRVVLRCGAETVWLRPELPHDIHDTPVAPYDALSYEPIGNERRWKWNMRCNVGGVAEPETAPVCQGSGFKACWTLPRRSRGDKFNWNSYIHPRPQIACRPQSSLVKTGMYKRAITAHNIVFEYNQERGRVANRESWTDNYENGTSF